MKNPVMLEFILDQLKPKKVCEQEIKKLPYLLRYVREQ